MSRTHVSPRDLQRMPLARMLQAAVAADRPAGPYEVVAPVLEPSTPDGRGENGHGTAVVVAGDEVRIIYQERAGDGRPWHFRHARLEVAAAVVFDEERAA